MKNTHPFLQNKIHILIILVFFLLFSCKSNKDEFGSLIECFPIETNKMIIVPLGIALIDEVFYIADFFGEEMIIEYHPETDFFRRFAIKGNGPSEFIGPLEVWSQKNNLYIHDRQTHSVGYFEIQKNSREYPYKYKPLFKVPNTVSSIRAISDSLFIGRGYFADGRYALINQDGLTVSYFGDYPKFSTNEVNIPFDSKAMFHQAFFSVNYEKSRVVSLSSHILDIIDFSSGTPIIQKRLKLEDYEYDFETGNIVRTSLRKGYSIGASSVTSCKDFIYFVFSSRKKGEDISLLQEIHTYDWNGNFIEKRRVNCHIDILFSKNDGALYGIADLPDPTLVRLK